MCGQHCWLTTHHPAKSVHFHFDSTALFDFLSWDMTGQTAGSNFTFHMLFPYTWFLTFFPLSETVKQWDLVELIDFLWYLWLVALWHMFTFTYVTMWAVGNLGTGNLGLSFACHLPFNSSSGRCQTWGIPAFQVFDMICFEFDIANQIR